MNKEQNEKIKNILEQEGYKLVCRSMLNGTDVDTFMNRETFDIVSIDNSDLDMEDVFNMLQTDEGEIKEKIAERMTTEDGHPTPATKEEIELKIDWEDKDFKAVIREIIDKANKRWNK